jgi:hypothetical protein
LNQDLTFFLYGDNEIDAKENKGTGKDFEPRPNFFLYEENHIDAKENKRTAKDFESIPNFRQ